ncbi:hypothetical protein MKEN_00148400 [Mycena kentingensis (nom. inval.)]|nr:hypothetical protein MKEN_00148400 [Mycena kentingensis (nom. inval.)]
MGPTKLSQPQNSSGNPVKRVQFAEKTKAKAPTLKWPRSLPFRTKPPRCGQLVIDRGRTPAYFLAWKLTPLYLEPGPSGRDWSGLSTDFVDRWVANWNANPPDHRVPRPCLKLWIGASGANDADVYFVAYSNHADPAAFTLEDAQYARDALPEFAFMCMTEKRDELLDAAFRWYRQDPLQ